MIINKVQITHFFGDIVKVKLPKHSPHGVIEICHDYTKIYPYLMQFQKEILKTSTRNNLVFSILEHCEIL